ncbi:MAG: 4'-phosphopantetheinyl transferase superfamily protein [Elusimicrobiota bacterium]|jgi:phosphopantetheine--protein transferase-like protein|nr:4'-phosphopantetheinyl transferase superfamily protein [Elusimicrobiota bacterium]
MDIGIDIENISRFKSMIEVDRLKNKSYLKSSILNSIFTNKELDFFLKSNKNEEIITNLACFFSCKESILKAFRTGLINDFLMTDIEIFFDKNNRLNVKFTGSLKKEVEKQKIKYVNISYSHIKDTVISSAVIEK